MDVAREARELCKASPQWTETPSHTPVPSLRRLLAHITTMSGSFGSFRPYLGKRILEVESGVGTFAELLLSAPIRIT